MHCAKSGSRLLSALAACVAPGALLVSSASAAQLGDAGGAGGGARRPRRRRPRLHGGSRASQRRLRRPCAATAIVHPRRTRPSCRCSPSTAAWVGRDTTVVRRRSGRESLPGFNDAHSHLIAHHIVPWDFELHEADSVEEVLDLVRAYALRHPDDERVSRRGVGPRHGRRVAPLRESARRDRPRIVPSSWGPSGPTARGSTAPPWTPSGSTRRATIRPAWYSRATRPASPAGWPSARTSSTACSRSCSSITPPRSICTDRRSSALTDWGSRRSRSLCPVRSSTSWRSSTTPGSRRCASTSRAMGWAL